MEKETDNRAKGGLARAKSLTQEERFEIASNAANKRWHEKILKVTHGSYDHPLIIGDMKIQCFVLEDETRVLTEVDLTAALGMARGGSMIAGMNRIELFVSRKSINPFISNDLVRRIANPIKFLSPNGRRANGFEATLLVDICEAVLKARDSGVLQKQQEGIATRCEMLIRGLARVGIVALVDEATGYQKDRTKDALARILEAFIAKELQSWVSTFPSDYYEQMFRLRKLEYPTSTVQRPQYFGTLTNDIIYRRLAPGVLKELKDITPKDAAGRRKHKFFQRLTNDTGYMKLREHLGAVVAIMKLSTNWHDFIEKLDRLSPRYGDNMLLPFDYDQTKDSGEGM